MKNGKCPTWFVVKWLGEHPKHTAKAPGTLCMSAYNAQFARGATRFSLGNDTPIDPYPRSDWTIYDERGIPVEFKQKPRKRQVIVSSIEPGGKLHVSNKAGELHSVWENLSNKDEEVSVQVDLVHPSECKRDHSNSVGWCSYCEKRLY